MLRVLIFIALSFGLAKASCAQIPQISSGIRVMMSAGYTYDDLRKTNPDVPSFIIFSQPIIESVISTESGKSFKTPTDLLQFFSSLPSTLKGSGLWVTRLSNGSPRNKSDHDRISALIDGALGMDFPIFICETKQAKKNVHTWLVAWECNMEFPRKEQPFICEPGDKAKQPGPPLWDCVELLSTVAENRKANTENTSASDDYNFKGIYVTQPGVTMPMKFDCKSDADCSLEVTSSYKGKPLSDLTKYSGARHLKDLEQVRYSYNYARDRRAMKPTDPRHVEMLSQLEPLFLKNPEITVCIDLVPEHPKYVVACKLSSSPWNLPAILYFWKTLDSCGTLFCGFQFLPLVEDTTYARETSQAGELKR